MKYFSLLVYLSFYMKITKSAEAFPQPEPPYYPKLTATRSNAEVEIMVAEFLLFKHIAVCTSLGSKVYEMIEAEVHPFNLDNADKACLVLKRNHEIFVRWYQSVVQMYFLLSELKDSNNDYLSPYEEIGKFVDGINNDQFYSLAQIKKVEEAVDKTYLILVAKEEFFYLNQVDVMLLEFGWGWNIDDSSLFSKSKRHCRKIDQQRRIEEFLRTQHSSMIDS